LKILFPFVGDSVGGSHHSIIELHRELSKNNISSSIVVHQKGPLSLFLDDIGIVYEYLPVQRFAGEKPNIISILCGVCINFNKIYKYIKQNKISIVHGNDLRINFTWSLPTKLSSASYVWHQRTTMSSSALWKFSNILADHFVTTSNYVHRSLPKNIEKSKKTLALNPFNVDHFYQQETSRQWLSVLYNVPKKSVLFGYIGRLVDWKNVDFLICCFAECVKRFDLNLHLIIVGAGGSKYVDTLKQLVCKLEISRNVTFAGFNSEPSRVISAFDLMIAPSNKEPFGRTIVEAMIQKTPVIAARGGGHIETIKHRETGWLYSHGDIEDFIVQLKEILNEHKMTDNIVQKAHIYTHSKYSSTKHVENMKNIYNQLY
jgi:glycosyltransferase involved in cell wall biosynthesis